MNKNDLLFLLWGVYNMATSHDGVTPIEVNEFLSQYSQLYDKFELAIQDKAVEEFKDDLDNAYGI